MYFYRGPNGKIIFVPDEDMETYERLQQNKAPYTLVLENSRKQAGVKQITQRYASRSKLTKDIKEMFKGDCIEIYKYKNLFDKNKDLNSTGNCHKNANRYPNPFTGFIIFKQITKNGRAEYTAMIHDLNVRVAHNRLIAEDHTNLGGDTKNVVGYIGIPRVKDYDTSSYK